MRGWGLWLTETKSHKSRETKAPPDKKDGAFLLFNSIERTVIMDEEGFADFSDFINGCLTEMLKVLD